MASMFVDNDEVIERKHLISNLNMANSKLRACETLLATSTQDRVKFMEGASWVCNKVFRDTELHADRVDSLLDEFCARVDQ